MTLERMYPWQDDQWQQLMANRNRLPHALLFMGTEGLGKKHFALTFAQSLLCTNSDDKHFYCGQCQSCFLFQAGSHPDFQLVEPEQTLIKIDQIREIVQFVNETALRGGLRIIIIHPANAMNMNAANALLKTLEEPGANTLIILIGHQSLRLPATITSRCQKILFQKPTSEIALNWLQSKISLPNQTDETQHLKLLLNLANGAPLKSIEIQEKEILIFRQMFYQGLTQLSQRKADPLQLATQFQEQDMLLIFHFLFTWLQDILRYQLTEGQTELINFDYQNVFAEIAKLFSTQKIMNYLDHVKKIYSDIVRSMNLNRQLVLEELFIRWVQHATG